MQRLPEFIIIGAAKAATTWVGNQLRARPDVFLPMQEPHYFSREYDRGEDWYRRWFDEAAEGQRVGEKSANYLADPHAAERIARLLPRAKLVVQLRNPIERAYSDYCMLYRRGTVDNRIDRYLGEPDNPEPRFLNDGLYFRHLSRFLEWFPESTIKVIFYDDIRRDPQAVIDDVGAFLGLPELATPLPLVERANVKDAPLLPLALRRTLAPAKSWVAPLRSKRWFNTMRKLFARDAVYPPLSSDLHSSMRDYFANDVEKLAGLLGRDLGHWLTAAKR